MRTRIDVPDVYKEIAEAWGAKYDGRMKSYYVPDTLPILMFQPFISLSVELVPSSNWEKNVRSELKEDWDDIRRAVYRRADYVCEVCKDKGKNQPIEAHEMWSHDEDSHIQKLEDLIALCPACHRVKHWGFALNNGLEEIVRKQIKQVNGWKDEDVDKYIREVFLLYSYRSKLEWQLDLSYLSANLRQIDTNER